MSFQKKYIAKVDYLFSTLSYRALKISVFLAKKLKIAKFGKLNLTKQKDMKTI